MCVCVCGGVQPQIAWFYQAASQVSTWVSGLNYREDKGLQCAWVLPDTQPPPRGEAADSVSVSPRPLAFSSESCRPTGGVSPLRPERSATRCKCERKRLDSIEPNQLLCAALVTRPRSPALSQVSPFFSNFTFTCMCCFLLFSAAFLSTFSRVFPASLQEQVWDETEVEAVWERFLTGDKCASAVRFEVHPRVYWGKSRFSACALRT